MVVSVHESAEPPGGNAVVDGSIQQNKDIAESHGKKYPTGPNIGFQPVEEIGHKDSGNDHDGGKFGSSDVVTIGSGSGHIVPVQYEEVNDCRL